MNLFLIGMMGSWKSTIGRKLSDILDLKFIDTDDEIEKNTKMKVSNIFQEYGEIKFRQIESDYFIKKSKNSGYIFSTGGGIILKKENRKVLQNNGICIFLDASPKVLASRINHTTKRPLLSDSSDIVDKLQYLWNKRLKLYQECATYTINTDNLNPNDVLNEITKILENINENN